MNIVEQLQNVQREIMEIRKLGKTPIILMGEETVRKMNNLYGRTYTRFDFPVSYFGEEVRFNLCFPNKCEVVVKE